MSNSARIRGFRKGYRKDQWRLKNVSFPKLKESGVVLYSRATHYLPGGSAEKVKLMEKQKCQLAYADHPIRIRRHNYVFQQAALAHEQ
jgi:hypothetical protein